MELQIAVLFRIMCRSALHQLVRHCVDRCAGLLGESREDANGCIGKGDILAAFESMPRMTFAAIGAHEPFSTSPTFLPR